MKTGIRLLCVLLCLLPACAGAQAPVIGQGLSADGEILYFPIIGPLAEAPALYVPGARWADETRQRTTTQWRALDASEYTFAEAPEGLWAVTIHPDRAFEAEGYAYGYDMVRLSAPGKDDAWNREDTYISARPIPQADAPLHHYRLTAEGLPAEGLGTLMICREASAAEHSLFYWPEFQPRTVQDVLTIAFGTQPLQSGETISFVAGGQVDIAVTCAQQGAWIYTPEKSPIDLSALVLGESLAVTMDAESPFTLTLTKEAAL